MELHRKSSIPLFYAHWFTRNSHPNSTIVQILIYTIEVVSATHHLRAMASQQRWNYIENQVSHYFMPIDLFGTPTLIAQLCKFWYIRLKWCLQHTTCELWHRNRDGITSKIKYSHYFMPTDFIILLNVYSHRMRGKKGNIESEANNEYPFLAAMPSRQYVIQNGKPLRVPVEGFVYKISGGYQLFKNHVHLASILSRLRSYGSVEGFVTKYLVAMNSSKITYIYQPYLPGEWS